MQSVNRYLEELYSVNESKNGMIVVKVIFDDKDSLITSINGTLEDAKKYYIGKTFVKYEDEETGEEYKHKAIKVEQVDGLNEAVNTKQDVQEFKDKLKKEIVKKFKGLIDPYEKDALEMDLEMALYWYANDYHSGQSDIWYSILSTSDYKPGRSEKELDGEENPQAEMFYDYIKSKYNKKINESMDTEVHTFDKPMDMFRQIVKESQAIYVKEKDGKIEGRYNPKPKKDWILVDGLSANKAVKLYNAATDEQKAKIDKISLTRFLNALWK